jgi:hypothetical protein
MVKLNRVLIPLFLLLLPTQLGKHFWPSWTLVWGTRSDYLSPALYVTDLLILLLLVLNLGRLREQLFRLSDGGRWLLASLFIFALVNSLLAASPPVAGLGWLRVLEIAGVGWLVHQNRKLLVRSFFWAVPFWLLLEGGLALFQWLEGKSWGGIWWWLGERSFNVSTPGIAKVLWWDSLRLRAYGTFSHPNSLAGFVLISSLLWLSLFGRRHYWLKRLVVLASGLLIFLTFSLSTFLVVVGLLFFPVWKKSRPIIAGVFFVLGSILTVETAISFKIESILSRLILIKTSLKVWLSSPIIGVGWNNFVIAAVSFWKYNYPSEIFLQPVHNVFLLVLAETGLIGLGVFVWMWLFFFQRRGIDRKILAAVLVTGILDHYWLTLPQNWLLLAIVFGLCFNQTVSEND